MKLVVFVALGVFVFLSADAQECDAYTTVSSLMHPEPADPKEMGLIQVTGSRVCGSRFCIQIVDGRFCYDVKIIDTNVPGIRRVDRTDTRGNLVYYSIQTTKRGISGDILASYNVFSDKDEFLYSADLEGEIPEYVKNDGAISNTFCQFFGNARIPMYTPEDLRYETACPRYSPNNSLDRPSDE